MGVLLIEGRRSAWRAALVRKLLARASDPSSIPCRLVALDRADGRPLDLRPWGGNNYSARSPGLRIETSELRIETSETSLPLSAAERPRGHLRCRLP